MFNTNQIGAVAVCAVMFGVSAGFADEKPKGAKPMDAQSLANAFVGKTHNWKDCKGGIYYGSGWEAQAWCHKKSKAVGIGKWSVNARGRLCHDLTWYWKEGDGVGQKHEPVTEKDCTDHVVAPDGKVWRSWGGEKDWWRLEGSKSIVKGFKHKSKIDRLRRQLGI